MKQSRDSKFFKRTKQIIKLQKERNNYIKDQLHKISKRIVELTRGLFKTNSGMLINADINGALNILRRYTKCIPKAVQAVRDNGRLDNLLRIRIA